VVGWAGVAGKKAGSSRLQCCRRAGQAIAGPQGVGRYLVGKA
jgi:hypothetical protein